MRVCGFPCTPKAWNASCHSFSQLCSTLLNQFSEAVGPFNIYNFYDNCGGANQMDEGDRRDRGLRTLSELLSDTQVRAREMIAMHGA